MTTVTGISRNLTIAREAFSGRGQAQGGTGSNKEKERRWLNVNVVYRHPIDHGQRCFIRSYCIVVPFVRVLNTSWFGIKMIFIHWDLWHLSQSESLYGGDINLVKVVRIVKHHLSIIRSRSWHRRIDDSPSSKRWSFLESGNQSFIQACFFQIIQHLTLAFQL